MYRRLRILESNYGRECGWFVEFEGKRLAELTDVQFVDMFWDSYRLQPLTTDPIDLERLRSDAFWDRCDLIVYRNCEFGDAAPLAFPQAKAADSLKTTGRLGLRGLYLDIRCYPWDRVLLWMRRFLRRPHT